MLDMSPLGPRLRRWLSRGRPSTAEELQRCIELQFLYRGVSTLELRSVTVTESLAAVEIYARPIFPDDRRIQHRTREAACAEQLFHDAVTVLDTIWRSAPEMESVRLSVWVKTVDGVGHELPVLTTHVLRAQAAGVSAGRVGPFDVLRRFSTRARIDRHGNFHDEREL